MIEIVDRRLLLGSLAALGLAAVAGPARALAAPSGGFVMWHSPGCGCCLEWGRRMEAHFKRKLTVIEADMAAVKKARGVPGDLVSCHTALVQGYTVEGHVPPVDIARLVASKSKLIRGLAVAGMPAGSPGMDVGHDRTQPYQVIAFSAAGRRSLFARHG